MKLSEPITELAKALSLAQGEFTAAERAHLAKVQSKKGEGSSYSYNYADLQAYLDVVREPLSKNGLSFVQLPTVNGDLVSVVTILMHASGQLIESDALSLTADHDPDKRPTPQAVGSAITYARRYSLSAITGMASESDDDGAAASGLRADTAKREPLPDCPKCKNNKSVIVGKPEYGGGFVCYDKKGGCGAKWQAGDEERPMRDKPANGSAPSKAAEVAAQHGLKTGDQIEQPPKSCYVIALKKIKDAKTPDNIRFLEDWSMKQHKAGHISEGDMLDLSAKFADREDEINAKAHIAEAQAKKQTADV